MNRVMVKTLRTEHSELEWCLRRTSQGWHHKRSRSPVIFEIGARFGSNLEPTQDSTWMDLWRDNSGAGLSLNLGPMEDRNNCCVFELKELAPDGGRTRRRVTTEPKLIFQNFQVGAGLRVDRGPGQDRDDEEDLAKQSWCQMRGGVGTKTKQKQT
ncbi:hypothetical protein COLO4_08257 [Corchorus olitorius]|uniref:Uncharacterized protein n=1 Tax=Corchorus olitorius TaxID=93759 RepID=A0A1R3KGN6_9ROSI|nr:hypothetical protein COLO4_08257 [Corchorus olitorius]